MMKLAWRVGREQHAELATACSWAGGALLTCADDQSVKRTDAEEMSGETVAELGGYPTDMRYCPSVNDKSASDVVAVTCSDGSLRILQGSSGREEKRVQAYTAGAAIAVAWSLEGTAIATGGEDGVVKIWSRVGMLRNTVATMRHPVYCVCWGRDDALLFSSGKMLTIEHKQHKQVQWKAHDGSVLAADWSGVNNLIVSGGEDCKYRVWDAYGRQLFSCAPLENVVTCVSWAPNGSCFAAGSFNLLKVCDRTGWTVCREDMTETGSLLSLAWSDDGTLLGGACASGAVLVAEVTSKAVEWKHLRAVQVDSRQIELQNCLEDHSETLVFRDRVLDMALGFGYLVVHTATPQVHVYSVTDLQSPTMVDVPAALSSVLVQGASSFLAGWSVFTYEGRRVCSQQALSGINSRVLDRSTVAMNDKFLAVLENSRDAIRLVDIQKGKPIALIKHKLSIVQVALGDEDLLAFLDSNGDLFVHVTGKKTFKLPCTMVASICFNESGALVAAVDDGNKLQVFFYPGVVWVDQDLLEDTRTTLETPHLAAKQPKIVSFVDNLVTVRDQTGAMVTSSVSRYPALLCQLIRQRKWEDAIRLCRFVEQRFLWAILAAKALDRCHLDSAEIGLAALRNVAKLQYILYIKDLPSEKARVAELALYKRDIKAAEAVLLQSTPPLLYRAIKMNLRMHRWARAKQIASKSPDLGRLVELYEKQWSSQALLEAKELKELKALKLKYSDKPQDSDDEQDDEQDDEAAASADAAADEDNDAAEGKAADAPSASESPRAAKTRDDSGDDNDDDNDDDDAEPSESKF